MKDRFIVRTEAVRQRLLSKISKLDLEKPHEVAIKPYVKKRSLDQNALYWKWLTIIHEETGQDKDDLHEIMMRKFLEPRYVGIPHEQKDAYRIYSTKRLTTAQFSEYMEKINAWASDFGIALPHPEDRMRHD